MKAHRFPSVAGGRLLRRGVNASHWLGQHPPDRYADPARFCEADVAWIAGQGYDHIRIPVDGRILLDDYQQLLRERLTPFDAALDWAEKHGLAVIFDMHYLEGTDFVTLHGAEAELYHSPDLLDKAATLWRQVAAYFHGRAPHLGFEVLNEAIAPEHEQLNELNRRLVSAIRDEEPERLILVSSNLWGMFETAPHLDPPQDPNLGFAFHFYDPLVFTHQFARWTDVAKKYPFPVAFPTRLTDLAEKLEPDDLLLAYADVDLDTGWVRQKFSGLAEWAQKQGNPPVIIDEFGTYRAVPMASGWRWLQTVRDQCEENGFGWTVWDYRGGFAVREDDGDPTYRHRALFEETAEPDLPEAPHPSWSSARA